MPNEIWKDIEGFIGYQVSNTGRIRSYKKFKAGRGDKNDALVETPHILDTDRSDDGNGYKKVMLRKNGKSYCRKIHRLVAEAFIHNDNPIENDTVDHISNDKRDNRVENLRWMPRGDNVKKAYKVGAHDKRIENRKVPLTLEDMFTGYEYYFKTMQDAADYLDVDYTTLSHGLSGSVDFIIKGFVVRRVR